MELPLSDYRKMAVAEFDTTKLLAHASQQAKDRGYDRFPIVDVDSHHYESESMAEIIEYLDDPVLRQLMQSAGQANAKNNGVLPTGVGYQDMGGRVTRYPLRKMEKTDGAQHRDITLTKRWMDAIGVDVAIMFPTPMLQLGVHPQVEVEIALARAYNRWLCEKVLAKEPRIRSMLYLPFNDAEASFRMVQEFGKHEGVCGFMVTAARYRPVHHNSYMKTYALMEELNLPLGFHAAYNWNDQSMSMLNRFISVHALGFTFHNMVHMANWIVNGIPERFPKLKVVWIESGLAWIPFMMQRFDNEYMMRSSEAPALKKMPSDYMRDMFFTSQPMEMTDMGALETTMRMINAETQLMYSSDYPHWDFDLPSTIYDLPFLSETAKRNILGGNAIKLFDLKLPAQKMARVASANERSSAEPDRTRRPGHDENTREDVMLRLAVAAVALLLSPFAATAQTESLKVAISQRFFWDSSFVEFAEKAGFFKEAGLTVEPFYTDGGAATLTTVLSGSADIGLSNGLAGRDRRLCEGRAGARHLRADDRRRRTLLVCKVGFADRFAERSRDQDHLVLLARLVVEPDPARPDETGRLEREDGGDRRRARDTDPGDDRADRCRLGGGAVRAEAIDGEADQGDRAHRRRAATRQSDHSCQYRQRAVRSRPSAPRSRSSCGSMRARSTGPMRTRRRSISLPTI